MREVTHSAGNRQGNKLPLHRGRLFVGWVYVFLPISCDDIYTRSVCRTVQQDFYLATSNIKTLPLVPPARNYFSSLFYFIPRQRSNVSQSDVQSARFIYK